MAEVQFTEVKTEKGSEAKGRQELTRIIEVSMLKDKDEVLYDSDKDDDNVVYSQEDTETKGKILKQKNLKR